MSLPSSDDHVPDARFKSPRRILGRVCFRQDDDALRKPVGTQTIVQTLFPLLERCCIDGLHPRMSSPTSRHVAECVNAPTEMRSTPDSAMVRTVSRFTPPLASN